MPLRPATSEDENPPDIATLLAQQLQNLLHEIVNQVTTSVNVNANNGNGNGANGGNGGNTNNGYTYKSFMSCNPKEYDGIGGAVVLTRWIERIETIIDNSGCAKNQKMRYVASSLVNKALTWWNTQVQARGREAKNVIGSGRDVKKAKGGANFATAAPSREGFTGSQPWCAKCHTHHHEKANCKLALGWRRNDHGGGNQVRGRAYNANMNAAEAAKDSNIVT
ncbi:hypothetical protein Tco_0194393, partial [Tanacetum coccineum]